MKEKTLLGHLALGLSKSPENIATEALCYLLSSSPAASNALCAIAQKTGITSAIDLRFSTQPVVSSSARPDLVGRLADGSIQLLIEAKFWAGLTDAQPNAYIEALTGPSSGLMFIAPELRLETLWTEILRRCREAGRDVSPEEALGAHWLRIARVDDQRVSLVTWRGLIDALMEQMISADEITALSDVRQLRGLCEDMDEVAFRPLRAEEFAPDIGIRVAQYQQLALDLVDVLLREGIATAKGLTARGGLGWYGRYLRLNGAGCCLYFSADRWANTAETPLWLEIKTPDWKVSDKITSALLQASIPCFFGCDVPLFLKTGVERPQVIEDLVRQLRLIAELIPKEFLSFEPMAPRSESEDQP